VSRFVLGYVLSPAALDKRAAVTGVKHRKMHSIVRNANS